MKPAGSGRSWGARSLGLWPRIALETGGRLFVAALGCIVALGLASYAAGATQPAAPAQAGAGPAGPTVAAEAETWRVVVLDLETGEELWSAPARTGDPVWYTYTHSADKTPVQSLMRVSPEGLVLELERYLWYGAGLEFRSDRGVVLEDGWVVVHAQRPIGRLVLRVAGTVEQAVIVGGQRTTLGELAAYGRRVALEVRP